MVAYKRRASLLDDPDSSDGDLKKPRLPSTLAVPGPRGLPRSVSNTSFASSFRSTKQIVGRMTRGMLERLSFRRKDASKDSKADEDEKGSMPSSGHGPPMRQIKGDPVPVEPLGLPSTTETVHSLRPSETETRSIYPPLPAPPTSTGLVPLSDLPTPPLPQKVPRGSSREAVDLTGDDDDEAESSGPSAGPSRTSSVGPAEESTTSMSPNEINDEERKPEVVVVAEDEVSGEDPDDPIEPIETTSPKPHQMSPRLLRAKRDRQPPERPKIGAEHHEPRSYSWMSRGKGQSLGVTSTPRVLRSKRINDSPQSRRETEQRVQRSLSHQIRQLGAWRNQAVEQGDKATARQVDTEVKAISRFTRLGAWNKRFTTRKLPNGALVAKHRTEETYRQSIQLGNAAQNRQSLIGLIEGWGSKSKPVEQIILAEKPAPFDARTVHKTAHSARVKAKATKAVDPGLAETLGRLNLEQLQAEQKVSDHFRPKLSEKQKAQVVKIMADPQFKVSRCNEDIKAGDIARLKPGDWVNDLIINAFGGMLQARANGTLDTTEYKNAASQGVGRKIHYFNSFFYNKLTKGYDGVRRWSKKFDLFDKDLILFPINMGNLHWTAAAINLKLKRFEYYDSLGDGSKYRDGVFSTLRGYLEAEHQDKKKLPMPDLDEYTSFFAAKAPHQDNGSDCGVFACQTLEALARGKDLSQSDDFGFRADDMRTIRKMMVWEIAEGKLVERTWGV